MSRIFLRYIVHFQTSMDQTTKYNNARVRSPRTAVAGLDYNSLQIRCRLLLSTCAWERSVVRRNKYLGDKTTRQDVVIDCSQPPGRYLHNADCVMRARNTTPESGTEIKDKGVSVSRKTTRWICCSIQAPSMTVCHEILGILSDPDL